MESETEFLPQCATKAKRQPTEDPFGPVGASNFDYLHILQWNSFAPVPAVTRAARARLIALVESKWWVIAGLQTLCFALDVVNALIGLNWTHQVVPSATSSVGPRGFARWI